MPHHAVDVLILSTYEGHHSIASSIADTLRHAGISCHVAVCPDRIFPVYRFFVRYRPSVLRMFYDLLGVPLFRRLVWLRLRWEYTGTLFSLLEQHSPRLLISTNYAFEASIDRYRARIHVPYVNIVTDPRTYFLVNLSRVADVNCVFDEHIAALCRGREARSRVRVTGWFVRKHFTEAPDKAQVRERLGLERDPFTIFLAAGWEGSNQVLKILPALLRVHSPVQIVVACGNNERMRRLVSGIAESHRELSACVRLIALPFTRSIHLYMQAADLVVGKAGPNMLFESVATGTPFFAITHNHGQEDGNLDIIRDYRLGLVEENSWRARRMLRAIVERPETLAPYLEPVRSLARVNRASGEAIIDIARDLLSRSVDSTRGPA
jgi:UDP-N-acetylglucosamine:LPS N-acetylglucosamine transferase